MPVQGLSGPVRVSTRFPRAGTGHPYLADPAALADCESSLDLEPENEGALKFRELVQNKLKM